MRRLRPLELHPSIAPPSSPAPQSRARLKRLESEIRELRGGGHFEEEHLGPDSTGPVTMPTGGWCRIVLVLAEMGVHQVALGELGEARRTVHDGLLLLGSVRDAHASASASMLFGQALLGLSEAHRARERFEVAAAIYDELRDVAAAARARVGLARALVMLRDPSARAVLEDAGTLYEELGDEEAVLSIDLELRQGAADFEESPRSFHAYPSDRAIPIKKQR
jgi:hypothetical protein